MSPALEISNMSVAYGRIDAVREVSLSVPEGSVVTVIGPNGAGKTTLLHAAMGVLRGRGGLRLFGHDLSGENIEERVRAGLCLVPESRALFSELSVQDNLELGAWRLRAQGAGARRAGLEQVYALFPRLLERRRQLAGTLSGGERQMLAMGRALMARPRVLMLDEPSLGLAPLIVREIFAVIGRLRAEGVAVLLVEQNARAALAAADIGYVLEGGRVTLQGAAAALASDARVVHTYLGLAGSTVGGCVP
jgi:branched-chain amino acid transport system ATP-binding protein